MEPRSHGVLLLTRHEAIIDPQACGESERVEEEAVESGKREEDEVLRFLGMGLLGFLGD